MKYCTKCGKEYNDSLSFCTACGTPLVSKNEDKNYNAEFTPKKMNNTRGGKKVLSRILFAIATVIVVAFVIFGKIQRDKEQIEMNKLVAFAKYCEIGTFGAYGVKDLALVKLKDDNGRANDFYGFINRRYEEIIPCIYQRIERFEGEQTIVKLDNKYALMNKKGEIEPLSLYQQIDDFCEYGFARALTSSGEYCMIGRRANSMTRNYEWIDPDGEWRSYKDYCLLEVRRNDKVGFINQRLREVIPCEYDEFTTYQDGDFNEYGLIKAEKNGFIGCLGFDGSTVIPFEYLSLWAAEYPMASGLYVVCDKYREWGMINYKGDSIIDCKYETYDYERSQGIGIAFDTEDRYRDIYDTKGKFVKTIKIPDGEFKKISLDNITFSFD